MTEVVKGFDAKLKEVDGEPVADSRDVAKYFGKEHHKVMRSIRSLECSEEFRDANFGVTEYIGNLGQKLPYYLMNRDGFMILAMGFTGAKAAKLKEAYIQAFNKFEAKAKNVLAQEIPQTYGEALLEAGRLALENEAQKKVIDSQALKIESDEPKIAFYDALIDTADYYSITNCSKVLGIKYPKRDFFPLLRRYGFLTQGGWPSAKAIKSGVIVMKLVNAGNDRRPKYVEQSMIPKSKLLFWFEFLQKKGIQGLHFPGGQVSGHLF